MSKKDLERYIRSINPVASPDMPALVYGLRYRCYQKGKLVGIFTWTQDDYIGDSFQHVNEKNEIEVAVPDGWQLVNDSRQK